MPMKSKVVKHKTMQVQKQRRKGKKTMEKKMTIPRK